MGQNFESKGEVGRRRFFAREERNHELKARQVVHGRHAPGASRHVEPDNWHRGARFPYSFATPQRNLHNQTDETLGTAEGCQGPLREVTRERAGTLWAGLLLPPPSHTLAADVSNPCEDMVAPLGATVRADRNV